MYYLIAIITFAADQLWKLAVLTWMQEGQTIPLWENVFHLTSIRNRGAAFGILQNQQLLFIIVTFIVIAGIICILLTIGRKNTCRSVELSLLLGGALGNFYDRIIRGEVVDSLDFRLINFPVFNLADVFIFAGVVLIMWDMWNETRKSEISI